MEGTRLSLGQPRLIQVLWEETSMARWQSLLYLAYPLLAALLGQLLKLVLVSRSLEIAPTSPAALAASLGLALLLVTPLALLSGRLTAVAAVLLSALSGAVAWIDASYYRYFTDLPSARQLSHAWQLTDVGGSVGSLLRWSDLWLFADTVALARLFWYFPPPGQRGPERRTGGVSYPGLRAADDGRSVERAGRPFQSLGHGSRTGPAVLPLG
jgi:hypothetical protein